MAGGMRDGRKLKAVIPGGSSMPVLPADLIMQLIWILMVLMQQVLCWVQVA